MMETKDLLIKESTFDELDIFYEWEKRPEVTEFFSISKDQTKEDVYNKFFKDSEDPGAEQFTIFLKEGSTVRPVGRIVMADIIPGWKGEVWRIYIADTSLRNKGYGRQALKAVMDHCFKDLGFERLYLDHYTGNPAGFLYKSMGFTEEGVLRKNCRKDGVLHDVHLMSILRDEYEKIYE